MKLPRKAKHWHEEISQALTEAIKLSEAEYGELTTTAKQNLYKYAPLFAMKNRGLFDKSARESVIRYCAQLRSYDFSLDEDAINCFGANFTLSYLDAHVCMQEISEHKAEQLLEAMILLPSGLPEVGSTS